MERVLVQNEKREVNVTLTERELFLIKWGLELMQNTLKDGRIKYDVEGIRNKLSRRFFISKTEIN